MFRYLLLFLLLLAGFAPCHAKLRGKERIDSLEKELSKYKDRDDTLKVDLLTYLADTYGNLDPVKGSEYGQQALALARKLSWRPGIGYAYNSIGMIYYKVSENEKALQNLFTGKKAFEEIGHSDGMALILNNMSLVYNAQGEYTRSQELLSEALNIEDASGNKRRKASTLGLLGSTNIRQGNYDKALEYYAEAIKINKERGDTSGLIDNQINIGSVYNHKGDRTQALNYYFAALKMLSKMIDRHAEASVLANIGSIYAEEKEPAKAKEYFLKALEVRDELKDKQGKASVLGNLGALYDGEGNYEKAMEYYTPALEICKEINDKEGIAANMENMSGVYLAQGKYISAIAYATNAMQVNEQIGNKKQLASSLIALGKIYWVLYNDTSGNAGEMNIQGDIDLQMIRRTIPGEKSAVLQKAIIHFEKGIVLARSIGITDILIPYYADLAKAYDAGGDPKKALLYYKQAMSLVEADFKEENSFLKASLQHEYDLKKHTDSLRNIEKEHINQLKLQRQRTYTTAGVIGMLLLAFVLFFAYKANKLLSREKKRSEALLLNILPAEIAAELKDNGAAAARMFDDVTIMFTDFVSFTQATELVAPQQLIAELDTCFKAFDEIITRHNMEKIKTIGDAYLAVCGLPMSDADHAANVINAAKEIRDFMLARYATHGNTTFEIRIGVHTGSVVAGIVGIKKFAYDIWGDAVNTAARMEQSSESGRINVSEATHGLVKDKFAFHYRGEIEVKNKGAVKMYFVQ